MNEVVAEVNSDIEIEGLVAKVLGEDYINMPKDLYIPPGAMQIFLDAFEGPLDLLLYLIKRQNLDILNIPIAEITRQYVSYVEMMGSTQIELAAEYMVMAAMLAEIKSRMLLPKPASEDDEGADPRAELVRLLQEYERFKTAAMNIDQLQRHDRDFYTAMATPPPMKLQRAEPEVLMDELLKVYQEVMHRAQLYTNHQVEKEQLSIGERMTLILEKINSHSFITFGSLFTAEEGRRGVVVTFIAILELMRQSCLELVQAKPFAPIYIKARAAQA